MHVRAARRNAADVVTRILHVVLSRILRVRSEFQVGVQRTTNFREPQCRLSVDLPAPFQFTSVRSVVRDKFCPVALITADDIGVERYSDWNVRRTRSRSSARAERVTEIFIAHDAVYGHRGAELHAEQDELDDGSLERAFLLHHGLCGRGRGPVVVDVQISHLERRHAERKDKGNHANGQRVIGDGFVHLGKLGGDLRFKEGFQESKETDDGETHVEEDAASFHQGELVQEHQHSPRGDFE